MLMINSMYIDIDGWRHRHMTAHCGGMCIEGRREQNGPWGSSKVALPLSESVAKNQSSPRAAVK